MHNKQGDEVQKVILDCDPGHDDALAILLAAASDNIDLVGITTVSGNQTVDKTTLNALRILSVAGIDQVPVVSGASKPLLRSRITAPDIHGESGLDGPSFGIPKRDVTPGHAVDFMVNTLLGSRDSVTIVATGPLTNVALLLRLASAEALGRINEIVFMGGSIGSGNVTPSAEFNIYADPEAAHIVLSSGLPIVMVGLETTHQALVTREIISRMRSLHGQVANIAIDLMLFFSARYKEIFGFDYPPLHDPCAVAKIIDPDSVSTQRVNIQVELNPGSTYGATVCDVYGVTGRTPNADLAIGLNRERFWELVLGALVHYK